MELSAELTRALQKKELEILLYFKKICEENNLTFYLCGGCLIGALRHEGFVPWDDDVDIFMPRPDYELLARIWNQVADTKRYRYCRTNARENYHDGGASIRDCQTTFINRHSQEEDICHGLGIEIMPIDACPSGRLARWRQLFAAFVFSLFNVQRLPDNKGRVIRRLTEIIYRLVPSKRIRWILWKRAEKTMRSYSWAKASQVRELVGSIKGMLLSHPKEDFTQTIEMPFEGVTMPIMRGYDRYMRLIWGDYMQLPPEEQRVAKHDVVFIDLENSYRKYKGKYYCKHDEK